MREYTNRCSEEEDIAFFRKYTRQLFKSSNIQHISTEEFDPNKDEIQLYVAEEFDPDGTPSCFRSVEEVTTDLLALFGGTDRGVFESLLFKSKHDGFIVKKDRINDQIRERLSYFFQENPSKNAISPPADRQPRMARQIELTITDEDDDLDGIPEGPPSEMARDVDLLAEIENKPKKISFPAPLEGTKRFYTSEEDELYPETAYVKLSCERYIPKGMS